MMKKLLPILIVLFAIPVQDAAAKGFPHISYGLEWSYTGTFLKSWQHNFICSEGYRIVDSDDNWWYYSNGSLLANAGVDLGRYFNLSVYSGLSGVYSKRWMIPVEGRLRYCPSGLDRNGPIFHLGAGAMFPTAVRRETSLGLNLGGGYRVSVFRKISVDFLMSMNFTTDHDQITDPDTRKYVPTLDITRNSAQYYALRVTAAINF
ncbi:MAG: hypothetical protein IKX67_02705 [Bacteroidales bacterium]|nr:hypothetical protein [Bacteroidales bacterium]